MLSLKYLPAADFIQELANALQSAQPKIQKMCEEESDDQEAVAKLFEINDSIHRTIERYKLIKKGDIDGASKIPQGTLGTSTGVSKTADNELSLIDFGGDPEPMPSASRNMNGASEQKGASLQDDLLGLSIQDQDYGQGGGIALGFGANSSKPCPSPSALNTNKLTSFVKTYPDHRYYHQLRRTAPQRPHRRLQYHNHSKLLYLPNPITALLVSWRTLFRHHDRVHLHHQLSSTHSKLQDPPNLPLILLPPYHRPLHVQRHHFPTHNHSKSQLLRHHYSTSPLRNLQYHKVNLPPILNKLPTVTLPTMIGILPQRYPTTVTSQLATTSSSRIPW